VKIPIVFHKFTFFRKLPLNKTKSGANENEIFALFAVGKSFLFSISGSGEINEKIVSLFVRRS
jgi:hypothetical protein